MDQPKEFSPADAGGLVRKTVVVCAIVTAFIAVFTILSLASQGIIAICIGVLLAVLLDGGARGLGHVVSWSRKWRLVTLFFLVTLLAAVAVWWGGTTFVEQASNFSSAMKNLITRADTFLENGAFGIFPSSLNLSDITPSGSLLFGGATAATTQVFSAFSMGFAIVFLGAFFAWEPGLYKAMLLSVMPKDRRARMREVLNEAAEAMREWLLGQSVSMVAVFVFSLMALFLIGMPYPILLSVLAGLLTFIPTLGPLVAGVVIILAGLSQDLHMAALGLAAYLMIQFLETNLLTPLVQQRTVSLPPAFTLGLQLLAGFLFGWLGVAFIVPLSAAGKVFITELYIKDRLGGGVSYDAPQSALMRTFDRMMNRFQKD